MPAQGATVKQIREALVARFAWMNGLNTVTLMPPAHVHRAMTSAVNEKTDDSYPLVVIATDGGKVKQGVSRTKYKLTSFDIIFFAKKIPGGVYDIDPEIQAENFIDDLEKMIDNDTTLGNLIDNYQLTEWTTDAGFADPEGLVWAKLAVEYQTKS